MNSLKSKQNNQKTFKQKQKQQNKRKNAKLKQGKKGNYITKNKQTKKQTGGLASFPFDGELSNYDYLSDDKDFSGKQPYWSVNTR